MTRPRRQAQVRNAPPSAPPPLLTIPWCHVAGETPPTAAAPAAASASTPATPSGSFSTPPPIEPPAEEPRVELSVLVGTWNMGNSRPTNWHDALEEWLPLRAPNGKLVDLLVLGVQEAEFNSTLRFATCEAEWRAHVREHLGDRYVEVAWQSLWEIRIHVAVRAREAHFVSNVNLCVSHTGRLAGQGVL